MPPEPTNQTVNHNVARDARIRDWLYHGFFEILKATSPSVANSFVHYGSLVRNICNNHLLVGYNCGLDAMVSSQLNIQSEEGEIE